MEPSLKFECFSVADLLSLREKSSCWNLKSRNNDRKDLEKDKEFEWKQCISGQVKREAVGWMLFWISFENLCTFWDHMMFDMHCPIIDDNNIELFPKIMHFEKHIFHNDVGWNQCSLCPVEPLSISSNWCFDHPLCTCWLPIVFKNFVFRALKAILFMMSLQNF